MHTDPIHTWQRYRDSHDRIVNLLANQKGWNTTLPACPLWTVRDVIGHMTAVAEDWLAGTLTIPPTATDTAAQVARFADHDLPEVLRVWATATERLQRHAADGTAPPLGDIVVHEHDIRGALGAAGARDDDGVRQVCDQLLDMLATPVPIRVAVEDGEYLTGARPEITLRTTRFEVTRWGTGRRSLTQLAAMDWSDDPAPVLDHLYLFGPAEHALIE